MLYKKYHRNYVRQFKKGTRFSPSSNGSWDLYIGGKSCEVICNPIIFAITEPRIRIKGYVIVTKVVVSVGDDKRERRITLTLINSKGKLINYVSKD